MVRLAPGDVLFKEGERGDAMFVLIEGTMDIIIGGKVVENSQRGAIIGEMALFHQSPRGATAVARGPARLAKVDPAAVSLSHPAKSVLRHARHEGTGRTPASDEPAVFRTLNRQGAKGAKRKRILKPRTTLNWLPKPATRWTPQIMLFANANCGHELFK